MKKTGAIFVTSNYDKFDFYPMNREVRKLERVKDSMARHGFMDAFPIGVVRNGKDKLLIKFGHHRFEAARQLGLPVKYVFAPEMTVAEEAATTQNWKLADFLSAFTKMGKESYVRLSEFHRRTGIPITQCIALLAGQTSHSSQPIMDNFKAGIFAPSSEAIKRAERVAQVVAVTRGVAPKVATKRSFIIALTHCLLVAAFDQSRLQGKIKSVGKQLLVPASNVGQYEEMLEEVYNARTSAKLPLAFMAREAAAARGNKPVRK